ncbi:cobyric acid synthase [Thalassospira mesophila]|uniref:Cobyric acid synthase n=1 Tax=Thalassospira mesophila TaxID=1293891 RepID=A0A1Y2L622_9PROT|nr:cobyric acid synthase [Thalassospira mesophila]OSQ40299.1 cobalamin biosynthesis protein CobQ [Thalassospira mesophila]
MKLPAVKTTPALMLQGTGSDVGKSLLVAGLCRAFARRGLRVRPFKPQNMSNNAAVTADGGEIGRAQALQARACGVETSVHMNPVLLKPQSDIGAQVVVQGQVLTNALARDYYRLKRDLLPRVIDSFDIVARDADLVIVEGAGSPAEVNLRAADIANMGFAEATKMPVVLVGDIDRGGVIASIVGTHVLLSDSDRQWLRGYIINKFRGDVSLFEPALDIISERTGLKSFGIATFWPGAAKLPPEDGVALGQAERYRRSVRTAVAAQNRKNNSVRQNDAGATAHAGCDSRALQKGSMPVVRVAVPHYPQIANFDDLDPLLAEPGIDLVLVKPGEVMPVDCDLVVLPGSKSTLADLRFLKAQGWDIDIMAHWRNGGHVMGICGGYQMLGNMVRDPDGVEGAPGDETGLGLLDVETVMAGRKTLRQGHAVVVGNGRCPVPDGTALSGYEIHMGHTTGPDRQFGWVAAAGNDGTDGADGAVGGQGRVMGCYLHGIFASDDFRRAYLAAVAGQDVWGQNIAFEAEIDATLDRLADHLEKCLDLDALWELAQSRK